MVNRAFSALNRNLGLVLVPIFMDLMNLLLGLASTGFWGESKLSLKLALDVGLPSIATVLEHNVLAGPELSGSGALPAMLLALFFLLLGAFVEAGFIGLLCEAGREKAATLAAFVGYAKRFWLRMLGLRLLISVTIYIGGLVAMLLSIIGVIAFLVIFLILRVKYIYWEYVMVSEDIGIARAFNRSRLYFQYRTPQLNIIILSIFLANFVTALIVNWLWHPVVLFIAIPFYCYLATGLQLALMKDTLYLSDVVPELQ